MDISVIAHLILLLIVMILVAWIVSSTFDTTSFFFAVVITGSIIAANPKLLQRIDAQSAIQYYVVLLIATMFFSIETCNSDKDLTLLLVLVAGVTMVSLYVGERALLYISIFLNTYTLIRIATILWSNGTHTCGVWG